MAGNEGTQDTTGMVQATPEQIQAVLQGGNINQVAAEAAVEPQQTEEETKTEETPAETPPAATEETPPAEETPAEEPEAFNLEFFNKQFSTEFADEDGVKEALASTKRVAELEAKLKEFSSQQEELDMLREENDPMKYFENEDELRAAMFRKAVPGKDPAMVAKLFGSDLSQASDFDVLTWMTMLDNPGLKGGEAGARELVADLYGIDDPSNLSDLDTMTLNKLMVSASKERQRLDELKQGVQLPEKKDYSSLLEQRKQEAAEQQEKLSSSWQTVASAVVKEFPDIVISDEGKDGAEATEVFRYSVGKDMTEEFVAPIVESMIKAGVPVDQTSAVALGTAIQKEYVYQNMDKIVKQAIKTKVAEVEEKTLEEEHNPGTPNEKDRPTSGGNDNTSRILQDLRGGGAMSPKRAI
jgi:hypothetical protein